MFPASNPAAQKHIKAVEELIREHGCYRAFGDTMLLTDDDIRDLFRNLQRRGADAVEPQDADEGHMVFIGSRRDTTEDVFVTWAAPGNVDRTISQVKEIVPDVELIDFAAASYGTYKAWTTALAKERRLGKWFARTKKFNAAMQIVFATGENDNV